MKFLWFSRAVFVSAIAKILRFLYKIVEFCCALRRLLRKFLDDDKGEKARFIAFKKVSTWAGRACEINH